MMYLLKIISFRQVRQFIYILLICMLLSSCSQSSVKTDLGRIKVVASTSIVGEFVHKIGGDHIDLTILIPPDSDPHTFEPRPQDIAAISEAQIVFINGLGLEEALVPVIDANIQGKLVEVSQDINKLQLQNNDPDHLEETHDSWDPHTWMDPMNIVQWTNTIEATLIEFDAENTEAYRSSTALAQNDLEVLDKWIQDQVTQIPMDRRKLVSDHQIFGYFARRYDFELTGLVISSFSTNASPSAQEIAQLQNEIKGSSVPAIFVSHTANPKIAEQIANDLGVKIVQIFAGSLSQPGGDADTYDKYMRFNVAQIVEALK